MKFDWRNFTEADYNEMLKDNIDYCGAVHIGDICIEIIAENGIFNRDAYVMCNFYVADEDTGYGYTDNGMPYAFADGFDMEMPYNLSYNEFKEKMENLSAEYIEAYNDDYDYSLAEHANRPLEVW